MVVSESSLNAWRIIALHGQFIVKNLTLVRRHFELAGRLPRPLVAIDMGGVSQLDSSAVTLLVNFQRRIIRKDGLLVLYGLRDDIAEIFSILGIDRLFRTCTGREDFETVYASSDA